MSEDLLWAVKNADLEAVKKICSKPGFNPDAELPGGGRAPLHVAADYGHTDVIEYLVDKGANVNLADKHGITPLLAAIYEGHVDCVRALIQKGANKNLKGPDGTPYVDCAETDEIKTLLR